MCRFKQTVELWFHFKGFFFAVLYKMWAFYSRNEKSDGGTDEDESHEWKAPGSCRSGLRVVLCVTCFCLPGSWREGSFQTGWILCFVMAPGVAKAPPVSRGRHSCFHRSVMHRMVSLMFLVFNQRSLSRRRTLTTSCFHMISRDECIRRVYTNCPENPPWDGRGGRGPSSVFSPPSLFQP